MTTEETLDLALEALEESVDLVREDYENAKKLYSNYPSRQARLLGLEDGLSKHEAAITAIKQARSAPVQEPVGVFMEDDDIGHARLIPHQQMKLKDGDKLYATPPAQPAPVQEPVATLWQHGETGRTRITMPGDITDCDARWFKAADLYTTPPAAQRQWVDPNEKSQKQFLPHIGEPVLFCHDGVTYFGKHTGGSFTTGQGITTRNFNTWECHWMYPPSAKLKENT
jgi:hypothetical protein